jgi:hypothetical protein
MPPTFRFNPGQNAYVRPCTSNYRVTLIKSTMRVAENGVAFPCWLVSDDTGRVSEKMQLELSSRPVSIVRGAARLAKGVAE